MINNKDNNNMSKEGKELLEDVIQIKNSKEENSRENNNTPCKLSATPEGFSERDLKRSRKLMKKAGIPKPWVIELTCQETGETVKFEL